MRTKLFISGLVASLFLFGTFANGWGQTLELKLTGCLTKKGKLRRVEFGTEPRKGDCKNNQELLMVPLTTKTDELMTKDMELMDKDEAQDTAIAENAAAIGGNALDIDLLEGDVADNADMINSIKTDLISSMWGGGHREPDQVDGNQLFTMPIFDALFCESGDLFKCESKIAVTGKITKLVVYQQEPQDSGDVVQYDFVINGEPVSLNDDINSQCRISPDSQMCETTGCIDVAMGDKVAVGGIGVTFDPPLGVKPARWTARFVEGGTCGPPPPPDNICTDYECPGDSELICDPEVGLTCEGEGASCQTVDCPEGTVLSQCGAESFTCDVVVQ